MDFAAEGPTDAGMATRFEQKCIWGRDVARPAFADDGSRRLAGGSQFKDIQSCPARLVCASSWRGGSRQDFAEFEMQLETGKFADELLATHT